MLRCARLLIDAGCNSLIQQPIVERSMLAMSFQRYPSLGFSLRYLGSGPRLEKRPPTWNCCCIDSARMCLL